MQKYFLLFILVFWVKSLYSQPTFPVNGMFDDRTTTFVIKGATIHPAPGRVIENGILVFREGKITGIGNRISIPDNAVVIDVSGKHIYPSFIELISDYGVPEVKKEKREDYKPQMLSDKKGAYGWNEAVKPEIDAAEIFSVDEKRAGELRKAGIGLALVHQPDGIARGSGALVSLHDARENEVILKPRAAAFYSFNKGASSQDYPSSLMGSIALLRQTYYDALWYAQGGRDAERNLSLEAWLQLQTLPQIFITNNKWSVIRADKVGDEFGMQYIIKGGGDEYQRVAEIKKTGAPLVIPLNFPDAYDVEDPYDALNVTLEQMKHWELAPFNPVILHENGIEFAFTTDGLKNPDELLKRLQKTVTYGLPEDVALSALTEVPARYIGVDNIAGTLEKGKLANFLVTSAPLFDEDCKIYDNWVYGKRYRIENPPPSVKEGKYRLSIDRLTDYTLELAFKKDKPVAKVWLGDSTSVDATLQFQLTVIDDKPEMVTMSFFPSAGSKEKIRLSGTVGDERWMGKGQLTDGTWVTWEARYVSAPEDTSQAGKTQAREIPERSAILYPFNAYGWTEPPRQVKVLFKNATIWTNEPEGILQNADLLIDKGKIIQVGENLSVNDALVIDCKGKHITPGIIDEHSHIAITGGVNEGTQASSAEVRIGDVINPEDINIYRQLAGGVVAAQLLHGSANPIGGQSAIIKFRWGYEPEAMKIKEAPPFIKFALGENVKQSNWGDNARERYPQTRMGVEQIYYNYFYRALEYRKKLENANKSKTPVRRDLELDALAEILEHKRFITCHSYVQSEINMLIHVADSLGFKVNTFTHILEGYKVADKLRDHGANASTFSDWWAYKYEVIDAIPYNAAILTRMGVNTAINSDDAEMGRRLNQEAAKTIKYGGLTEEEALKTITLNPARMLHIDHITGSIKPGKDADLVVWSGHPLSNYSKAEMTFVDGIRFWDIHRDEEKKDWISGERNRLIQKMIAEKKKGSPVQKPEKQEDHIYHCDDLSTPFNDPY